MAQERKAVPDASDAGNNKKLDKKSKGDPRVAQRRKTLIRWAILGVACVYAGITLALQQRTISAQKKEEQDLQQLQQQMAQELEILKEKEAYTGSDAYIERAAREKFGWVKDGEIIFRKQEDEGAANAQPTQSAVPEE